MGTDAPVHDSPCEIVFAISQGEMLELNSIKNSGCHGVVASLR